MEVKKETEVLQSGMPTAVQLEAINAQAKAKLTEEQVYVFCLRLCDDQVDRDNERFDTAALPALAKMFIGKTGIIDHKWGSDSQVARIFETQVVTEEGISYIKAWAYIRRGGSNDEIIADIDAGIKKEVSVGCSVAKKTCSICGADVTGMPCEHRKGERYDGKLCYVELMGAKDAYEFSFVAVPAQPAAGVVKGMESPCADLKQLAARHPACAKQLEALEQEAVLGRNYLQQLKDDVVRLGLLAGLGLECRQLREMANTLYPSQLEQLKQAYGRQAGKHYPMPAQLSYGEKKQDDHSLDEAFLI